MVNNEQKGMVDNMLRIITGREGCGKTRRIMNEISVGKASVLIVPEQYSHDAERLLCRLGGDDISMRAEVLSFTRLANRVFSYAGGLAVQYLDDCGRLLAMNGALSEASPSLKLFGAVSSWPDHLENMLSVIDEFRNYGVSSDDLQQASEQTDGMLSRKLYELALISDAYDAVTANGLADPTERLKMLSYKLDECDWVEHRDFYIDCFADFTKLESDVIDRLIARGKNVTVCLTCDDDDIYDLQRETIRRLKSMADRHGTKCSIEEMPQIQRDVPEFDWLDKGLFSYDIGAFDGACKAVRLAVSSSLTSECEWAAAQCRKLVAECGSRWNDICIAVSDMNRYRLLLERVFDRFKVPVYLSYKADIVGKPAVSVVCSALDCVAGGYEYEDVFSYLKSGFSALNHEQCDILENYVIEWNISGSMWKSDWTFDPQGYGREPNEESAAQLNELNELRNLAIIPLVKLEDKLNSAVNCSEMVIALYEFMLDIDLPGKLETKENQLRINGRDREADECSALWDVLINILEQTGSMNIGNAMSTADFVKLFKLAVSTGDIGTIPVYYDAVTICDIARMRFRNTKYLIVLGANDSYMPSVPSSSSVISEDERDELLTLGIELAPSVNERTERELGIIHSCFVSPTKELMVSYPEYADDGTELRPSMVVQRLKALFPSMNITRSSVDDRLWSENTAFEAAFSNNNASALNWIRNDNLLCSRFEAIKEASNTSMTSLSQLSADLLYGQRIRLSATRIDKFNSCKFSYFMEYGLKASARKTAEFAAPEYGTFVHYILENLCTHVKDNGGFKSFDKAELPSIVDTLTEQYVSTQLAGGLANKSQRFKYLFTRLQKSVRAVVENVFDELANSDFVPLDFELAFNDRSVLGPVEVSENGKTSSVVGFVDRVDGYVKDDKLYLRVVDYKTGKKSFDFTDIRYGMGLQMLIYLFALQSGGSEYYGKEVVPAGVIYMPARDEIIKTSRTVSDEELQSLRDSALTRSGLLIDDPEILQAMENHEERFRFLPVKLKKDGEMSRDCIASSEQLGKLARFVDNTLHQLTAELGGGQIKADPYKSGENYPCKYCEYAAVCDHDGESFRYLKKYPAEKFWQSIEEGEMENA
ncbi:MAG: ATP-dependent nuclease subunit B [Ruminococcaceae bacterium]|nr:ATP-dependent nuclease subunit B [Oscillospiraceae bacterium]